MLHNSELIACRPNERFLYMFRVCSIHVAGDCRSAMAGWKRHPREIRMGFERIPSRDIGLRHVLENGLALVKGGELSDQRRKQVLTSLVRIFSEADRGSQALGPRNLTVALDEQKAFDRFSAFYHYLFHTFGDELPSRLSEAKVAITEIAETGTTDDLKKKRLEQVLKALLDSLRRERALTPLRSPKNYRYR